MTLQPDEIWLLIQLCRESPARDMDQLATAFSIPSETLAIVEEQAALRHVATLVARQSPADEVFAAVAEEITLAPPRGINHDGVGRSLGVGAERVGQCPDELAQRRPGRGLDGRRGADHARSFAIEALAQIERNRALVLDDEDPPAVQHIFGIHQRAP